MPFCTRRSTSTCGAGDAAMTGVTLRLDGPRWREHLRTVAGAAPGLVPVIKGNGYGYGLSRLAQESADLGVDTIAVGTAREVSEVREQFPGDIVILHPWEVSSDVARELAADDRVITTVSRADDLERVPTLLERLRVEGWTIHLPLLADGRYAEAERLARAALEAVPGPLWFSHLPPEEASALARQLGGAEGDPVPVRLRMGTRLWLGDESARATMATVLDVHPIRRGV